MRATRETRALAGASILWNIGPDLTPEAKNVNLRLEAITHFVEATKRIFLSGPLLIESVSPRKEISYVKRPI
jgi:hypothetical protein